MKNRLYRSESNRVAGGVCSGLGEFLGIDPVFIRIFFIIWTVLGEFAVLVYFILWVVVPNKTAADGGETFSRDEIGSRFRQMGRELGDAARNPNRELVTYAGAGLIVWGAWQLLGVLNLPWLRWMDWNYTYYLWPALLIIAGAFILIRATTRH
jgi:phage shock protein PspC (stress-responsive transcriptional regulator)